MQQDDGSYIYSAVSDQAKEKLDFYVKLYQEGLLDNDYLTDTWETKENKFYSGEDCHHLRHPGRGHRRLQQQSNRPPTARAPNSPSCPLPRAQPVLQPLLRRQGDPRHGYLRSI